MLEFVIFVLFVGLLFYVLFGGADFGAGILEMFSPKERFEEAQSITYRAIGPVWEANHIWLILIIVVFFSGFPKIFAALSTYLHIPMMLMLLGIIFRGTAFVFRHYDAIKEPKTQKIYSRVFALSSFMTPLFLGMIAGGTMTGLINPEAKDFWAGYMAPWLNGFSFTVGLLVCALSAFLAAVFLIGEARDAVFRKRFIQETLISNVIVVLIGLAVFWQAEGYGLHLFAGFMRSPLALAFVGLATFGVGGVWWSIRAQRDNWARLFAGAQVTSILLAWAVVQFPVVVRMQTGDLGLYNTAAEGGVIQVLFYALIAGVLIILPALFFLFWTFKHKVREKEV